ncbi:MAG: APC family permease [Candidatus Bathyarchaeia archaeon]
MSKEGEEHALKREVGWYGSFAMGYADVGADLYVAIGLVAFYAAGASPIAFAIASITYVCTGLAYAELATAYPYAGGAQVYSMKAFNDMIGFVAGWAVMLDYTVDMALFSLASAGYLSFFFPWMKSSFFPLSLLGLEFKISYIGFAAFVLVIALLLLNSIGIRESSAFNELLVSLDLVVESVILITGVLLAFGLMLFLSQITDFGAPSVFSNIVYVMPSLGTQTQNFVYGITLAMTSFIGIESIAQAAEETKRPQKWIPRANKLSIIAVVVFAVGLSALSMGVMPWQALAASQTDPMAAIASRVPYIGHFLAPIVAFTGFTICFVSTNTGVIGASRVVFSMGRFGLMPAWFYKVHRKFRTPVRTIAVFGLIGATIALLGELHFVADLYNFGALLSYVIVNISLIVLRNKEPDAYRAWKLPGTLKIRFREKLIFVPVISVIGTIATGTMWAFVIGFHAEGRIVGAIWLAIGIIGFIVFRRSRKMSIIGNEVGKTIAPGAYMMNATVLVRTPEDEDSVVEALKYELDTRFRVKLLSIVDPSELGLSTESIRDYSQLKQCQAISSGELRRVAKRLSSEGFDVVSRVEIGSTRSIVEREMESSDNDVVVLIKRKTLKGHLEKREDSAYAIASRYPGKVMIVRRFD